MLRPRWQDHSTDDSFVEDPVFVSKQTWKKNE